MKIKLQEYMNRRKCNQTQLAKASKVPQPMISMIIRGSVPNPTIETVYKLATALKCTVDDLIEEE